MLNDKIGIHMGTAVLSLELSQFPDEIGGLQQYSHAFILLDWRGTPLGQLELPVIEGRLSGAELREAVSNYLDERVLRRWLALELPAPALTSKASPRSATVAVCTRDRPQELKRCLDALMSLPDLGHEILVVDNCPSTGETRQLVGHYPRVRYVLEERRGLDYARNRALCEARGEVVALIDDDAVPHPNWLGALLRNFDHPLVLCVTGLTVPLELETEAQEWFERYSPFGRGYDRRVLDWHHGSVLAVAAAGAGVNMALRRSVLEWVGPFNVALDSGTATQSGGDHEMFSRILAAGYRIVYEPAALSWHRHRRTWHELRDTIYGYGVGVYAAWTSRCMQARELMVLTLAWQWFAGQQLPNLARALLRCPGSPPLDLVWAELCGCAAGPWAYWRASRNQRSDPMPHVLTGGESAGPWGRQAQVRNAPRLTLPTCLPKITVIIPTHNRRMSLARTLEALAAQTYPAERMQVVVVADGCTDGTAETVRMCGLPFAAHLVEQPGRGAATARNRGAAEAEGELLLFLDDDIEPNQELVTAHVIAHRAQWRCVVLGPSLPAFTGKLDFFQMALRDWWADHFYEMGRPDHQFTFQDMCSGNISLHADLFAQVGQFDAAFRASGGEDHELGVRLIQSGVTFAFAPEAQARHHDVSNLDQGLRRAYQEGHAHVLICRRHPEMRSTLPIAHLQTARLVIRHIVRLLTLEWPLLGKWLAKCLRPWLTVFERARMRGPWLRLFGLLRFFWYWRGVAEEAGSALAWVALVERWPAKTSAEAEVEIDMSPAVATTVSSTEIARPAGVWLRWGEQVIGHIPAQPGAEPLRRAHVQAWLRTTLALPLAQAWALAGERPARESREDTESR